MTFVCLCFVFLFSFQRASRRSPTAQLIYPMYFFFASTFFYFYLQMLFLSYDHFVCVTFLCTVSFILLPLTIHPLASDHKTKWKHVASMLPFCLLFIKLSFLSRTITFSKFSNLISFYLLLFSYFSFFFCCLFIFFNHLLHKWMSNNIICR